MKSKIDSHIHLGDFKNIEEIIGIIQNNNQYALCVSNTPEQFEYLYKKGLHQNKYIKIALGYNPQEIINRKFNAYQFMKNYRHTNYIGEVGLDYTKEYAHYKDNQKDIFMYICEMVGRDKKLMSVHSRNAEDDILRILNKYSIQNFILHWYTGNYKLLPEFISLGAYFSINYRMTKSKKIIDFLDMVPHNRILVETDAPYILQRENMYVNIVNETYEFLSGNGINRDLIFNNFKSLLLQIPSI